MSEDLTDRKRVEEQLRASEEQFRATFDQAAVGIAHVGLDGRWLRVNRKLSDTVGYSPDELMAKTFQDITHPDDLDIDLDYVRRLLADDIKTYSMQKRYLRKDGSLVWVNLTVSLVRTAEGRPDYFLSVVEDITDRKKTEEELRYSEQLHRIAFDQSPTGKGYVGLDGRFTRVNPAMCEIAGYAAEELVGMPVSNLTHPDDRARDSELLAPFLAGQTPKYETDKRYVRKDGSVRWVTITARMVTDAEGRPLHALGVVVDITDRKRAEAQYLDAQRQIATTLESITDGCMRFDRDWRVVYLNAAAERMVRLPRKEMMGRSHWEIFPATIGTKVETEYRRAVAEQVTIELENYYGPLDAWYSIRAFPTSDGGLTIFFQDISGRFQAVEALRQSEARFRAGIEAVSDIVWTNDAKGMMTAEQVAWGNFTGQDRESYRGYGWSNAIHPDDAQPTIDAWNEAVAGKRNFMFEHRVRRHDGQWRLCSVRALPLLDERGEISEWVGVHTDITDRKRVEAELRRLAAELFEADRRKDEFIATLAHELRNPLAPIRNGLQLLARPVNGETAEQVRAMMDRQLSQLVRLVDDLLDVSRITSGKLELRKERVDLASVIHAAVETSRLAIEQAGHEFAVVEPGEPIVVDGDATRLAQVVSNLLINSAKYTLRGGQIRLTAWREDDTALLSVKDDGIGIPPALLGRVFEMFTQVDRSLEKTTGGLGIGLSLVKGLTEMHGGTIEARSDGEGTGSEFVLRLPVAMDVFAGSNRLEGRTIADPSSALRRFLVVDDNVDAADSLGLLLESLGNEVRIAYDGETAIEVAAQFRPDVVLMDIGMPKLNGYEAARRIRQYAWGRRMLLVALTGWGQEDDRQKSMGAGFDHHLVKPADLDALTKLMSAGVR